MNKRVVITGIGTINPLGDTLEEYYNNLIAGKSGVKRWESINVDDIECQVGGDLGDYDWKSKLEEYKDDLGIDQFKRVRKLFRSSTFSAKIGALSALYAYRDAGLLRETLEGKVDPYRTSMIMAGHNLNSNYIFENAKIYLEEPDFIDALAGVEGIDPNVVATLSEVFQLHGPAFTIGGACASGNLAMREGFRDIILGECDRAIVAGAPFDVSPPDIQASVIINAVVMRKELQTDPAKASRPFDAGRGGFVYSHGAGTIILESLESAKKRGAKIYAEVLGVKAGTNANHLPMPAAPHQQKVIEDLLQSAGVAVEQIDYVNCHATSTPSGDIQEILAIKGALGKHAYNVKLNAPKSMLGHTCWASPLVETIAGLLQMKHGVLHPSINIDELDPKIDLDVCANTPVEHRIEYMLKNSFGFGGINCCSLIKRFEE
jgi:3-oxoacyl-(acyl-carrier-protein) synthase